MSTNKRLGFSLFGFLMFASICSPVAALADGAILKSHKPVSRPAALSTQHDLKRVSLKNEAKPQKMRNVEPVMKTASLRATPDADIARLGVKQAVAQSAAATGRVGRIWCVPFAREVSGINLKGNARTWWSQADNRYAKGSAPAVGAVLNFRSTSKMPMGHVAVVSKVVSPRKILVDHANWRKNRISLDMAVVDVSRNNDWSAVRVETIPNTLGDVYPTYGFIYRASTNG